MSSLDRLIQRHTIVPKPITSQQKEESEEEKRRREQEESRKKELTRQLQERDKAKRKELAEHKAEIDAVKTIATEKYPEPKQQGSTFSVDMQRPSITQMLDPNKKAETKQTFNSIINQGKKFDIESHRTFGQELEKDLMASASYYGGVTGGKPIDIQTLWNDYIKPKIPENNVETTLDEIEGKLKEGEEGVFQSIHEGWMLRTVRNLLSVENKKLTDGEPNKVDMIEKWLDEHPEINDFVPEQRESKDTSYYGLRQYDTTSTWYDFKTEGLRGLGDINRLWYDSAIDASQNPATYAWGLAIATASILAVPATGGLSLGALPLTASAPLLASKMGTALQIANMVSPLTGLGLGMRVGSTQYMANLEQVNSYQDLVGIGVDPRIAKEISAGVGTFNGLLEQAQFSLVLKGIPVVAETIKKAQKFAINESVKGIGTVVGQYGKNLLGEGAEEVMQGLVTHGGTTLGIKMMENELKQWNTDLAPLPKTLQDFVDFKEQGYDRETIKEVIVLNGYGAIKSMWMLPLGSTMIQSTGAVAERVVDSKRTKGMETQIENINTIEKNEKVEEINNLLDSMIGEKGMVDTVIEDYEATKDVADLGFLTATRDNFKANLNKGFTNEQKAKMVDKTAEIDALIDKAMVEAKEKDTSIEFDSTNAEEIQIEILKDGYTDTNKTSLDEAQIERFKLAIKEGKLEQIRQGLREGKMGIEIEKEIRKKFKLNKRNVSDGIVDRIMIIRAVEAVDAEISNKVSTNQVANIAKALELQEKQNKSMETEKIDETTTSSQEKKATTKSIVFELNAIQEEISRLMFDGNSLSLERKAEIKKDLQSLLKKENLTEGDRNEIQSMLDSLTMFDEDATSSQEGAEVVGEQEVADEDKTSPQTTDSSETVQEDATSVEETNDKAELKKSTLDDVKIVQAKVNDIKFDTEKFQFRFDKKTDDRLSDVDWVRFNEGVVTLYQNEYGDLYAVDGHHRIEQMQERGIESVNAKILSYEDYTVEEARAIGAGLNIAEGNATSIDVAKVLRDSQLTKEELINRGVSPTSKILRDGEALASLNENIFNKVVTKGIGLERAVIIGKQLGGMKDAQNTLMKSLALTESKGKTITNDVLTELIAHARGMKQDDYEVVTLFGKETMTKDYTIERAELVSYVKNQLKSKKNLLKNISKDKNAVILQELGNKIAVDENVKNMEIADQALWILDKTVNYVGTPANKIFNELAKGYFNSENKSSIKKKALDLIIKEMEGNTLLDGTINPKVKEADIKAKIDQAKVELSKEEQQENMFVGLEDRIEEDNTPTRKPRIEYLKEQDPVVVVASNETMKEKSYTETIDIVEMMGQNPLFNGLTVEYTDELGEVELGKGELIARGYADLAEKLEQGETRIYKEKGYFKSGRNTIYLNRSATRSTIIEEAIHYAQQEVGNLSHTYKEAIIDWEYEVRVKSDDLGLAIPEGKETLAKALLHSEYGYASENPTVAKIFAVDQDILNIFEDLLGKNMIAKFKGESYILDPKVVRPLNIAKLRQILSFKNKNESVLAPNADGVYAQVYNQEGKVSAEFFSNQFGYLKAINYESMEDAVTQLANSNIYQLKEASNEYDRSVVDELSRVKFIDGEVNITPNGFREIREGILTGNFVRNDYDNLVKDNPSMTQFDKDILLNHLVEAEKKGLSKPNSEVTLKEFLYRFNDIDIEEDNDISWAEVEHFFLYNIDSTMEKKGFTEDIQAMEDIANRLKGQHKYFQSKVETYRNNGLQYQIEEERATDEVFYVGDEIEVIKNPSDKVYQDMYKEFRREYPNAPIGEPYIRTTYDMSGNKYIWSSNYTHSQVEPYINKKFDTQTNQNKDINYQLTETSPINVDGFYSKLENFVRSDKMLNKGIGSDLYNILKKVTTQEEMEWFKLEQINNNKKYTREDILSIMNERPIDIKQNRLDTFTEYTLQKGKNVKGYEYKAYSYNAVEGQEFYYSVHFGNLKNVVAHTRYQEVQDTNNNKIMLIEELQSDLHTKGKAQGYTSENQVTLTTKMKDLRDKDKRLEKEELELSYERENEITALEQSFRDINRENTLRRMDVLEPEYKEALLEYAKSQTQETSTRLENAEKALELSKSLYDTIYPSHLEAKQAISAKYNVGRMKELKAERDKLFDEIVDLQYRLFDALDQMPDAPFKKSAIEFMFKQNIKDAVNGGYDGIAWTTGLQQADRWEYDGSGTGFYGSLYDNFLPRVIKKFAKKYGGEYTTTTIDLNKKREGESADANEIIDNISSMFFRNEANMFDYAYDKSLVFEQPYMAITDEMRKMVIEEGQPIFQLEEVADDNLQAIHNLGEGQFVSSLKMGGFVMPSLAITRADYEHTRYGEISLLFDRDTIDPQISRDNRVYSGDAYTPTYPYIAQKISESVSRDIEKKVNGVLGEKKLGDTFRLSLDEDNMLDKIERYGNFKEAYQGEPAMMITYLAEKGIEFELPMTKAKYNWDYDVMDGLAKLLEDNLEIGNLSFEDYERLEPSIRAIINGYYQEALGKDLLKAEMGFGNVAGLFTNLEKYNKDTTKMVIDTYATKDMLLETIDQNDYSQWLDGISEGIIEKEGVRNNVDRFTPSGSRRKWETLHDPVTLKTLLKSMKSESEKASDAFGGIGKFRASVSDTFTSIIEIKKNAHRLQNIDEALYEEMQSEHNSRLLDLASRLADKRETNQFIATDRAIGAMVNALQSSNTKEGIMKTLGEYYGLTYDGNLVDEMMQLAYEVSQMPTEYFEAKPRRIIETKEVRGMVAPNDVSQETLDLARANGINTIALYDAEIDGDRARAVREVTQAENILFQMTEEQNETMDEYYNKAVSMDKEYLSWIKTLKKNPNISDAMKDLLIEDDFKYNVIHNIDTMVFASKALEKHGDEYWEGVLRNPDTKGSAIEFAVGQILTYKFMQNGQVERATAITDNMARKAKTLGQAIQILSVLGRQTPEGMMRYVSGMLSGLTTQSEKDLLNLQSEDVVEAFNKIDKEALKEVDFKEGVEQLNLEKSLIKKISDLANLYYKKRNFNLLNGLKELGLDEDGAKMVESFIRGKIDIATNKKKKALLEKNFKKQSYERATLDQDIIDTHNDGGIDAVRGKIAEKTGMPIFTTKDAQWVYDRSVEINKMVEGSREKDVAIARLMADIGDLIPVDKWDKVNLLQTMAQLMNAKTILRNLIGNAIFGTVDTFTHNYIGVPIDMLYSAFSGERTAIHRGIFKIAQQQWQGYGQGLKLGYEDAKLGIDTFDRSVEGRLGGQSAGNKYDIRSNRTFKNEMDKVRSNDYSSIEKVKALGTTALSKLETGLNITMRATDRGAFMGAYMDSIHEQLLINKVTEMKNLTYEQQEQIVANATALGLYRTFNDASTMSKGFRSIKKGLNLMSSTVLGTEKWGLGDLVLKYPQTPANILQRVIDYSPIGVVQTLLLVSRATDASGYLKQKMVVDSLARFISGTSTVAIGALLAYMGIATGGVSDEPDKIYDIKKQVGLRDYGINITALRRWFNTGFKDKTAGLLRKGDMIVSYDWVEPMAVPIAVGADILINGTEGILQTALDATATGVTALTEQPLLSGLTSLFGYGDIAKGTGNQIMGIPASFTPTFFGHIASLIDGGNKDPYTAYSDARIAYNKVINKLPFAKGTLPDRYSVFGERLLYTPEEESFAFKVFRNILSPAFYDRYDPEDEVSYILDLYEKTGELDIIPKAPQKSYTFDGEQFILTPQEYEEMSEWLGLQVTGRIKQALNINGFKNWSLPDQEEEIRHMLKELSKEARVKVQGMRRVE